MNVVPKPLKADVSGGMYTLTPRTVIVVQRPELEPLGRYLADLIAPETGMRLPLTSAAASRSNTIALRLDPDRRELGVEGYALECTQAGVVITASGLAGAFYGVQTLRQLLPAEIEGKARVDGVAWTLPCVSLQDKPRFPWRGYMLDTVRHFRTTAEIKRMVDLLALLKLNTLHLHLVDDQGWRLEIKRYPKLTEVGARLANCSGKTGEGWFYTQDEMRDLVVYAASRQVTVVPEIEMPGHSKAATTAYPELGCGGQPSHELCVSRPGTCEFMCGVLNEVRELFPSPFIHIGADEVRPESWRACSECKAEMARLANVPLPAGVTPFRIVPTSGQGRPFHEDIGRLQGEFVRSIDHHLLSVGRRMVGWDEILDGGLSAGGRAAVMAWRSEEAVRGAVEQGREVVVSLHPQHYLDNDTPLQRTYEYDPVPGGLPAGQDRHVLGLQGNMWGESTPTLERIDQQTFPRLCAIAEVGWMAREDRDFGDFSRRLSALNRRLDVLGVHQRAE